MKNPQVFQDLMPQKQANNRPAQISRTIVCDILIRAKRAPGKEPLKNGAAGRTIYPNRVRVNCPERGRKLCEKKTRTFTFWDFSSKVSADLAQPRTQPFFEGTKKRAPTLA
jgi:hypothetical protein